MVEHVIYLTSSQACWVDDGSKQQFHKPGCHKYVHSWYCRIPPTRIAFFSTPQGLPKTAVSNKYVTAVKRKGDILVQIFPQPQESQDSVVLEKKSIENMEEQDEIFEAADVLMGWCLVYIENKVRALKF